MKVADMKKLYDIHCHLLPYVDDGAYDAQEAIDLIYMQKAQGVETIVLTPHYRSHMFETDDATIRQRYRDLCKAKTQIPNLSSMSLFLSREYYCDKAWIKLVELGQIITIGRGQTLLMEFSYMYSIDTMLEYIKYALSYGYKPLIAHVERYSCIQSKPESAQRLIEAGAYLQVNAASILGREGIQQKWICKKLMKRDLVHIVASDAHHIDYRSPDMGVCAAYIEKKMGETYALKILCTNPQKITNIEGIGV